MATTTSTSSTISSRATYSCIRCADRKVKCDRQKPCIACVKFKVDCVYNPSPPTRNRHKRVKHQNLTNQLKHYEALLQQQGIDLNKLPSTHDYEPIYKSSETVVEVPKEFHSPTTSSIESEPNRTINKTQVLIDQGRSKFVDNSLWTRVVEEFHDREDALVDSSDDESDLEASDNDFGFLLSRQSKSNTKWRHPTPEHIHQLWQIFIDNIDPVTKVVHVPTLRPAIQKAASNIENIPRSLEALMFAIYSAAVMSLKDDECREILHEPRKTLLSRYISATKVALSRAKFMGTMNLIVLQALIIHILSVRDIYEPRAVWSLTGLAVRIAQGMGLERDGESLGLPPFEAELRRRIWWLLKLHDFRTAELCGLSKFRDLETGPESTKWPTNINDDQLYPGMPQFVAEPNKLTDAVFIALKCDFANFAATLIAKFRQQGKNSSQWDLHTLGSDKSEIYEGFSEIDELLEMKYLRYCDPSQPLHLMTMLAARSAMNLIRFLTHHPRRWASIEQTPLSERQWIWEISIKLLEQQNMLQSNPQLKQFAWNVPYYRHWHAFIHVLDTLQANSIITYAEKAWQLICSTYENNPDMIFDTKKPIHIAVGNLCLKAYSARETALKNGNMSLPPTPEFISQLREQREVAKAKKKAREMNNHQHEDPVSNDQVHLHETGARPDAGMFYSSDLQQNTTSHAPNLIQTGTIMENDPFWFINGFDDNQIGNSNDMMNMDPDFMLVQNYNVDDNVPQTFTWEQWDAWLADSNLIPALSSIRDLRTGT